MKCSKVLAILEPIECLMYFWTQIYGTMYYPQSIYCLLLLQCCTVMQIAIWLYCAVWMLGFVLQSKGGTGWPELNEIQLHFKLLRPGMKGYWWTPNGKKLIMDQSIKLVRNRPKWHQSCTQRKDLFTRCNRWKTKSCSTSCWRKDQSSTKPW